MSDQLNSKDIDLITDLTRNKCEICGAQANGAIQHPKTQLLRYSCMYHNMDVYKKIMSEV